MDGKRAMSNNSLPHLQIPWMTKLDIGSPWSSWPIFWNHVINMHAVLTSFRLVNIELHDVGQNHKVYRRYIKTCTDDC